MTSVQVIEQDGKPSFHVVPAEIWDRVKAMVEDAEDAAAFSEAMASDDGVRFPAEVAYAIADGTPALNAWRLHRQMTLQALADVAGVGNPYISQMENGKRVGTAATLKKLAAALQVPLTALT